MQNAESCSVEMRKEELKVAPCSHGRRLNGKFQNVPKIRRENEDVRLVCALCTQFRQQN